MMSELGLPDTVVDFMRHQNRAEGLKFTWKIFSTDDGYSQLTPTWRQPSVNAKPIHYRKKSPSEIRRDTYRKQDYMQKKWNGKVDSENMKMAFQINSHRNSTEDHIELDEPSQPQVSLMSQIETEHDPLTNSSGTIDAVPCSQLKTNKTHGHTMAIDQTRNMTSTECKSMITRSKAKSTHSPIEGRRGLGECDVTVVHLATPEKVLCDDTTSVSSTSDDSDHYDSDMTFEHEDLHKESCTVEPNGTSSDFKTISDMISSLQHAFDKHWDKNDT